MRAARLVPIALPALLALLAVPARAQQRVVVPPPPAEILASHTRIVLELPASGGVSINGQPIPAARLDRELDAIYSLRPVKVLLISAAASRTAEEIERVKAIAERRGIRVFAATAEGIRR